MTGHTHTPAEWFAFLIVSGLAVAPLLALWKFAVDSGDWTHPDWRLLAVRAGDRVLVEVVNARYGVREVVAEGCEFAADAHRYTVLSLRDAALTVAALLALCTPNGATR